MCSVRMVRINGIALSNTERHQTALRGPAQTCSHARTATRAFSSFRGILTRRASETSPCRRAGDAKKRARPPQGDDEQPGRRRGNRDPRALGVWPGCLPRRLQLVCTRSSGRNSLFRRCGNRCCRNRGRTPLGSMGGAPVTGLEANPTVGGVRQVPQRDHEGSKPQKKVSTNAVVVGCPSSACSSPGRARVSSWLSPIGCLPF